MVVFKQSVRFSRRLFICATTVTAAAATGLFISQLNDDQNNSSETIRQAELVCQAYKEKHGIPGISIGVTVHGRMIWKNGFGLADIEQRVPCTAETVMRIASISKIFTATIAGQFYEQGKFKWDDSIQKYRSDLPEFLYEKTPVTITMRQLASHTSGIRHYWKKGEPMIDDEFILPEYYLTRSFSSVTDALSLFLNDELLHRPGTIWLYTTHGYTLFSAILESIAGKDRKFADLLQDLVVKQMNLRSTKLEYPNELVPNRSRYYCRRALKQGLENVAYVDLSYKWAGGGMLSNVIDLLVFANTLLQCRQTRSFNTSSEKLILKSETLAEMWSPVTPTNRKNISYGLGWMIADEQRSSVDELTIPSHVFHTGGAVGATSVLLIIPCTKKCSNPRCGICVAILTNLQSAGEIYQTALDIALLFRKHSTCQM